jgi:hypothetical protein
MTNFIYLCFIHCNIQIVDTNALIPVDPRSPTAGITRTPFTVTSAVERIIPEICIETVDSAKELENLAQVKYGYIIYVLYSVIQL